ncbi:MAG: hypothetical protein KY434_04945 [Actinobacteria bacterium]|nr:hypothetical protein [Actinomycetota bacterium]
MADFEQALRDRIARNAELAREREQAERDLERLERERREAEAGADRERHEARMARHAELADRLATAARGLKAASPEKFVVRLGWTESGEEFIAKISTRQTWPARTLLVELDRDDDEVLVRWDTEVGNALELWRLLEVDTGLIETLVLQAADQELWRAGAVPPFPGSSG